MAEAAAPCGFSSFPIDLHTTVGSSGSTSLESGRSKSRRRRFREQHDLVGWVPGGKGKTPVVCATGVFHWWPDLRTSKFISESHPAMIGAGCPVLPPENGAGCLLHSLSPARMPLSSLRH